MPGDLKARYNPRIFDVMSQDQAMRIILTPDAELSTEQRWKKETPYLTGFFANELDKNSVVLDYGCGIGRMSKALIEKYNCRVVGADISASMRALAAAYVDSERFMACHPAMLDALSLRFDAALAVWVIQHTLDPKSTVDGIAKVLKPGGSFMVINSKERFVPTGPDHAFQWSQDKVDVKALLQAKFPKGKSGKLDPKCVGKPTAESAYWWLGRKAV